jgi:hypothetical protein
MNLILQQYPLRKNAKQMLKIDDSIVTLYAKSLRNYWFGNLSREYIMREAQSVMHNTYKPDGCVWLYFICASIHKQYVSETNT